MCLHQAVFTYKTDDYYYTMGPHCRHTLTKGDCSMCFS